MNPNTTPETTAYREEVAELMQETGDAIDALRKCEEQHAYVPAHNPNHGVEHYKLNLALDLLEEVHTALRVEAQDGCVPLPPRGVQ